MADRKFVLDPKSGYWGLAEKADEGSLRGLLSKKIKPCKCYNGVQVIALNTTEACNMRCIYCSTSTKRSGRMMPLDMATRTIDQTAGLTSPQIVFHGSEPLFNMGLIKGAVEYGESIGREIGFSIQTNLTRLTPDRLSFLIDHKVGISTSLDGTEPEHNITRPYRNGAPSYADVKNAIERVLKQQEGISVVCVVTKYNVNNLPGIALDFENLGISEVQFLPAVACSGNKDFMPLNADVARSYVSLFEQTFKRMEEGKQRIVVKNLSQYLSDIFLTTGVDACRTCTPSAQHPILAVDIDGEIYPCDFFWGDKERSIGNVKTNSFSSLLNSPRNIRSVPIEDTSCGDCTWRNICGGGCLGDRFFSAGKPYYCETHKAVFEYLTRNMDHLLESGLVRAVFDQVKERFSLR